MVMLVPFFIRRDVAADGRVPPILIEQDKTQTLRSMTCALHFLDGLKSNLEGARLSEG